MKGVQVAVLLGSYFLYPPSPENAKLSWKDFERRADVWSLDDETAVVGDGGEYGAHVPLLLK